MIFSKLVSGSRATIATLLLTLTPVLGCADLYEPMQRRTFEHDGIDREYFVYVPKNVDGELPVVFAIHGYSSTATGFQAAHDLNHHADQHGYMVVYPQGTHFMAELEGQEPFRATTWNTFGVGEPNPDAGPQCAPDAAIYACPPGCGVCGPCHWAPCTDDSGFFGKLLDAIESEFDADSSRFYALGVSNGGMMVLRIGCDFSDRFAAIAPIVASLPAHHSCAPANDLPIMFLAGGKDETIRIDGLPGKDDGFIYTSLDESARQWAESMQCESDPGPWQIDLSSEAGLTCTAYSDCRIDGQEVVSCVDQAQPASRRSSTNRYPDRRIAGHASKAVSMSVWTWSGASSAVIEGDATPAAR